jgi:hypothetical protein
VAQWQGTKTVQVLPATKGTHLEFPMAGL